MRLPRAASSTAQARRRVSGPAAAAVAGAATSARASAVWVGVGIVASIGLRWGYVRGLRTPCQTQFADNVRFVRADAHIWGNHQLIGVCRSALFAEIRCSDRAAWCRAEHALFADLKLRPKAPPARVWIPRKRHIVRR